MVRLAAVRKSVTSSQAAQLFVDNVFRITASRGLPERQRPKDRVPLSATPLSPSRHEVGHVHSGPSSDRRPDGGVNRLLEDTLRSVGAREPTRWSTLIPQVRFALNNAVHSSMGFTPFYVNGLRHPRTPLTLPRASNFGGGEANAEDPRGLQGLRTSVKRNLLSFIETGEAV
ncbi:unnamed protein product [Phytophthora fragariaefolia]|uniref:Unnamed protein product n=1 Tax=Phytophthora fragariaefolia TaxID=1490495 RepID=A0A9W6XDQ9_9STRA|nr:unnamed protein product [Phytophthora fragariaefolia]